jgi:hypothetical protein
MEELVNPQRSASSLAFIVCDVSSAAESRRRVRRAGLVAKIIGIVLLVGMVALIFGEDKIDGILLGALGVATWMGGRRAATGSTLSAWWTMLVGVGVIVLMLAVAQSSAKEKFSGGIIDAVIALGVSALLIAPGWLMVRGSLVVLRRRSRLEGWRSPVGALDPFRKERAKVPNQLRALRKPGRAGVRLLVMVLLLLFVFVGLVGLSIVAIVGGGAGGTVFGIVFVLVGGSVALRMFRKARLVSSPTAAELRANDPRRPVVYLRSFSDDASTVRAHWSHQRSAIENWTVPHERFEELVVRGLSDFGPVVAIGEPGERVPDLGSAREYLSATEWRSTVDRWIEEAGLIAVVAGRTEGLGWEVQAIVDRGSLPKTMLLFPPVGEAELRVRWEILSRLLSNRGVRVPAGLPVGSTLLALLQSGGAVAFCSHARSAWHYELAFEGAAELVQA